MKIYRYDAYVELEDDVAALALLDSLHLTLCGGTVEVQEDGTGVHTCPRSWELRISESRPVQVGEEPAVALPVNPSLMNFNDDEDLVAAVEEHLDA